MTGGPTPPAPCASHPSHASLPPGLRRAVSLRTGRRSHKTTRVTGQVIWPPPVEQALLNGETLASFKIESKTGKPPRRFPRRNVFLSQQILSSTGIYRTPKQVGSRLQQMGVSCGDAEIRRLLHSRQLTSNSEKPSQPPSPSFGTVLAVSDDSFSSTSSIASPILATESTSGSANDASLLPLVAGHVIEETSLSVSIISSEILPNTFNQLGLDIGIPSDLEVGIDIHISIGANNITGARTISGIPTISLRGYVPRIIISTLILNPAKRYYSSYNVWCRDICLHSSEVPTRLTHPERYETFLVPSFWLHLSNMMDLSGHIIIQTIYEQSSPLEYFSVETKPEITIVYALSHDTQSYQHIEDSGAGLAQPYHNFDAPATYFSAFADYEHQFPWTSANQEYHGYDGQVLAQI